MGVGVWGRGGVTEWRAQPWLRAQVCFDCFHLLKPFNVKNFQQGRKNNWLCLIVPRCQVQGWIVLLMKWKDNLWINKHFLSLFSCSFWFVSLPKSDVVLPAVACFAPQLVHVASFFAFPVTSSLFRPLVHAGACSAFHKTYLFWSLAGAKFSELMNFNENVISKHQIFFYFDLVWDREEGQQVSKWVLLVL